MPLSKILIFLGIILVVAGLLMLGAEKLGLGRLPGDIVLERDGFRLYLPITTSIIVSLALSLIFWLISR